MTTHEVVDSLLRFRPDASWLSTFAASQLSDEPPISDRLAAKGALGHLVLREEVLDLGQDRVMLHSGCITRVATRMQANSAGSVPILRVRARFATNSVMERGVEIDLAKLRQLVIDNAGPGRPFTRRGLSMKATGGRNPDLIRDLMRADARKPTIQSVAGICAVLGTPLSDIVKGVTPTVQEATQWLSVGGAVSAGIWREQTEWPRDDWYEIEVPASDESGDHFGVVAEGRSMEKIFPPGTVLRCVNLIGSEIHFQDGDYVIVERRQGSLYESTCKRLVRRPDGNWELCAESHQPEFKEPMFIGKPDESAGGYGFDGLNEDETRVKALVIDAYLPLRRRRQRPSQ